MRTLLAAEHPHVALLGLTTAATAATLVACLTTPAMAPAAIVIPASPAPVVPAPAPKPVPVKPAVPSPRAGELGFAFRAGEATYLRLASLQHADEPGLAAPRHGRLRHVTDDGVHAAIATVALGDVPADYAVWKDRTVKVNNNCSAHVTGFAVVARVTGDVSYAGSDQEDWDAKLVMQHGAPVLAAQLDGCTSGYARDAALPDPVEPSIFADPSLEAAGRAALIASAPAAATQREWDDQLRDTATPTRAWASELDAVTAQVFRHPTTGETFVSVRGHVGGGCGDPRANLWGLYRVVDDQLVPVQVRQLDDMDHVDTILDIDNDGSFELLGTSWLGDTQLLTHEDGTAIDQLDLPFYGCPC